MGEIIRKRISIAENQQRAAVFARGESGNLSISVSSDEPYLRYDWMADEEYYEVLSHDEKDIDLSRFKTGAPLLYNHDRDIQLGRIETFSLDGGKMRVEAKLSKADDVKSYVTKIDEGILCDTSIGYRIMDDGECVGAKDGIPIYKFKWAPHEASMVTIPADITVGAGRGEKPASVREFSVRMEKDVDETAKNGQTRLTPSKNMEKTPEQIEAEAKQAIREAVEGERKANAERVKKINDYAASFKIDGMKAKVNDLARAAVENGISFDDFRASVMENWTENVRRVDTDANIGMSQKEAAQFSLLRAAQQIISNGRLSGLEKEASDAAAKRFGRTLKEGAICIPSEVANVDLGRALGLDTRAQNVTSFTAGGATVAPQFGPMIEILNNAMVLNKLGITTLNGVVGDLILPQQTGGATAYWVSETGALTDSQATFAQKTMAPKRCGATIPFTTQFLAQSSVGAEAFLRNELMTRIALLVDLAGLEGTGVAGQPLGVKNTTGINATVTFGGAATWADCVEFETGINADNADIGTMGFALSSATVGKWKTILRDSVAGAAYLIQDNGNINGYGYQRTNQITGNIAFFGVWSQLLLAQWAGIEVIVDPYALKKSGQIEITANMLCDYLVRQPLAFNVSTDSAAQ